MPSVPSIFLSIVLLISTVRAAIYAGGYDLYCRQPPEQFPSGSYYACFTSDDGPIVKDMGGEGRSWTFMHNDSGTLYDLRHGTFLLTSI